MLFFVFIFCIYITFSSFLLNLAKICLSRFLDRFSSNHLCQYPLVNQISFYIYVSHCLSFCLYFLIFRLCLYYFSSPYSPYPSRNSSNSIYDFPVICFFLFSGLSLLFRGFSFPDSIRILQFFGGSLVVVLLLLRTSFPIFYFRLFFILISFYESLHLIILKNHPSFFSIYFLRQDIDPLQRSLSLLEGFNRIYGPSFNSTVTGTVLGVFCFSMLFDRSNFFGGAPKICFESSHILSFLVCFFSFLICQSVQHTWFLLPPYLLPLLTSIPHFSNSFHFVLYLSLTEKQS